MSAAAKAKRAVKDCRITVFEKTPYVSWAACGLPYYIGSLAADLDMLISRPLEKFIESGIDVRVNHEVLGVDFGKKTVTVAHDAHIFEQGYDKLVIATGAAPIVPPIKNRGLKNVFSIRDLGEAPTIKEALVSPAVKDVIILGGGFVGVEMAEAALRQGKRTRLIEMNSRLLQDFFDPELSALTAIEMISAGVMLNMGETVTELTGDDQGKIRQLTTDQGSYDCDLLILAAGVRPCTAFVRESGLKMLPNGALLIGRFGETSIKDVYAAGDCASVYHLVKAEDVYLPLATTANKLGKIVGQNLGGHTAAFDGTLGSAAIKFMEFEAGRTGITLAEGQKMGLDAAASYIQDKTHPNYYPGQEDICVKLIYDRGTRRILGGQAAGKKDAVLRVDALAVAIYAGLTVEQLGNMDFCYAPPFARTWDALNVAGNAARG
jgi:NADPH-dependent 2,4-dienoyl-CoA reductase/sulfur reductase-like enzyme